MVYWPPFLASALKTAHLTFRHLAFYALIYLLVRDLTFVTIGDS
jgi:hypothetical protein